MDQKEEIRSTIIKDKTMNNEEPEGNKASEKFQFKSIDRLYGMGKGPGNFALSCFKFIFWLILVLAILYGVMK